MGITYRAQDLTLGSLVALKVISARYSGDPETRERFRREARSAAQLRHPNVAGVFHFGETDAGRCFYAMELIEGETVEAYLRRNRLLPPLLALEITAQVARALIAAEAHGLVHRDLKPSNLMIVGNDSGEPDALVVKVIDFGLAKSVALAPTGATRLMLDFPAHQTSPARNSFARTGPRSTRDRTFIRLAQRSGICSVAGRLFEAARWERSSRRAAAAGATSLGTCARTGHHAASLNAGG